MNFFKKKNSQTNSKLTKPDIEKMIIFSDKKISRPIQPCYEKEDGILMRACAYRRYRSLNFSQSLFGQEK